MKSGKEKKLQTQNKEAILLLFTKLHNLVSIQHFWNYIIFITSLAQPMLYCDIQLVNESFEVNTQDRIYSQQIQTPISQLRELKFLILPNLIAEHFEQLKLYGYLIPLCFLFIFEILPIIILSIIKKPDLLQFSYFWKLCSIYSQIQPLYLYIPFNGFCFYSIKTNININDSQFIEVKYLNITLSTIILIWQVISQVLKLLLFKESLDLQLNGFKVLKLSFIDLILLLFNILQMIVYYFIDLYINDIQYSFNYENFLIIFMSINLNKFIDYILCYGMVMSTLSFISLQNQISNKYNTIIIVLVPISGYILITSFKYYEYYFMTKIKSPTIKNQKYFFAKYFNQQITSDIQLVILYTLIVRKYEQKKIVETQPMMPLSFLQKDFIPYYLIQYYFKYQLKIYSKLLTKSDSKTKNAYDYIHYVSILYRLGFSNLALKQVNILLFNKTTSYHSKSIAKENNSEQLKSVNTLGGAKSSISKSSKSQEVYEVAITKLNKINKLLTSTGSYSLNSLQKIKLSYLREKVRDKLRINFTYKGLNDDTSKVQRGIELFLLTEQKNKRLKEQIIQILNQKYQFFLELSQIKNIKSNEIFNVGKKLCKKIQHLEEKLNKIYQSFPSQRIQSMMSYYVGEILDNYLEAYRITANQSISDEKMINLQGDNQQNIQIAQKNSIELDKQNVIYMNVSLQEDTQELIIQNISPKMCSFFKKEYEWFRINNIVDNLLPLFIKNEHNLLVQRFLQNSKAKFYLNKNLNFFQDSSIIVKPCDFFFEINLNDLMQIQFFAFFSDTYQPSSYLLVDVNLQLGGITQDLFDKMGFADYQLDQLNYLQLCVDIEQLLPEFKLLLTKIGNFVETHLVFLKQEHLFSQSPIKSYGRKSKVSQIFEWKEPQHLTYFQAFLQIHPQDIYGYQYYIIEISDIKEFDQQEGNDKIETSINDQDKHSISNFFPSVSGQEAVVNLHPALNYEKQTFEIQTRNNKLFEIHPDQNQQEYFQPDMSQEINILLSPLGDISQNQFGLNSTNKLLKDKQQEQQEFFNQIINNDGSVSQYISSKQKGYDEIVQHNRKIIDLKEDTNSTSFAGIRRSQFFKKYEIIQQISKIHYPLQLKMMLILITFGLIIGTIHFIIIISKYQVELNQFINEVDMIELHSGFMAPSDLFVSMRMAIVEYKAYLTLGVINQSQADILLEPFYDNIDIGYVETKEVIIEQLSNENLQPFFKDRNIDMLVMGSNTSNCYNQTMNIREAFLQTVSNLYKLMLLYQAKIGIAGTPIQVFAVGNQFRFHFWLEDLTLEIFYYSKNRCDNIKISWIVEFVIFQILLLCITFLELYYFKRYYQKYDQFVGIFRFCNQSKLQFEIERYKILLKQAIQNSDILFQYKFDILQKEQELLYITNQQEILNKNSKEQQKTYFNNQKSLTLIPGISILLGIYIVYLILGIVLFQDQMSYLNKYSDTVDIYKLIQDMTYTSAELYTNRDYLYIWGNFSYLSDLDKVRIWELINNGLTNIDTFSNLCQNFDSTKYQISDDFINFLQDVQKNSICDVLGNDTMGFLSPFCSISIEGNLEKGILAALNYVKNNIQTQMLINNFTNRVEYPFYDIEAGIIIVRTFQLMTKKLKQSMLVVASDLISISNVLSIIYLLFSGILILSLITYIQKFLFFEYNLVKNFLQLLPCSVKMLDDQFERYVRLLLFDEKQ